MVNEAAKREEMVAEFIREVSRQSTWTVMFHQAASLRMGLNPTDSKCWGVLREMGPITAGDLAELTGLTTGAITGVIDRLEQAGFVRRGHDAHDRRRVIIELIDNPAKEAELAQIYGPLAEATINEFVARYSNEELALILDFTKRGAEFMKQQTARLQREKRAN